MISVFAENGIDRAYIVPGESYLGVLDALNDFKSMDVVVCRHEGGAAFMAEVDGKLTGRPGLVMVSRGPGATNASIGVHAAQQDGVPLILMIGQVPRRDLRKDAFQEIDYQKMFGAMAKWVYEATTPEELATAAFKAIRVATSGTPGPVVLVIPEDIQQQPVPRRPLISVPASLTQACAATVAQIHERLISSQRPLIIAGSMIGRREAGREALQALSEKYKLPVAVAFRQNDVFPNDHPLYAGHLDLTMRKEQHKLFASSDLLFALGTQLDDITTQGYAFPAEPRPEQFLIHCFPDDQVVNKTFVADVGLTADPVTLINQLLSLEDARSHCQPSTSWIDAISREQRMASQWPSCVAADGIPFSAVVHELERQSRENLTLCLDTGTFAASVYRNFSFRKGQKLLASCSGAMGHGVPAAIAAQMRMPQDKVVCLIGDGGFLMTGNEIITAVERKLPILIILSNNNSYGSIRVHQHIFYPHRHTGTTLNNPDFVELAGAFGMKAERVEDKQQIAAAINRGLLAREPYLIEVKTSLDAVLK